jgi:hypothetical protein
VLQDKLLESVDTQMDHVPEKRKSSLSGVFKKKKEAKAPTSSIAATPPLQPRPSPAAAAAPSAAPIGHARPTSTPSSLSAVRHSVASVAIPEAKGWHITGFFAHVLIDTRGCLVTIDPFQRLIQSQRSDGSFNLADILSRKYFNKHLYSNNNYDH